MSIWEATIVLHVPANACPFCDGTMVSGKEPSTVHDPGEYYYRCDSCGAGDGGPAFVDGFMDDADHPFDTPRNETAQWVIPESEAPKLREPFKTEAREAFAELDIEVKP